jgi:tRNA-dihydrouridine synthase
VSCHVLFVSHWLQDASAHRADWDAIAAVRAAVQIPVLANGDVRTLEDAQALMRHTGTGSLCLQVL